MCLVNVITNELRKDEKKKKISKVEGLGKVEQTIRENLTEFFETIVESIPEICITVAKIYNETVNELLELPATKENFKLLSNFLNLKSK